MKPRPIFAWVARVSVGFVVLCQGMPSVSADPISPEIREIWAVNCKKCHGWDGTAETAQGRKLKIESFTQAEFQAKHTDDYLVTTILEGRTDPADPDRKMKSFKDVISEAQAKELVKVVRAFATPPGPFPDKK